MNHWQQAHEQARKIATARNRRFAIHRWALLTKKALRG